MAKPPDDDQSPTDPADATPPHVEIVYEGDASGDRPSFAGLGEAGDDPPGASTGHVVGTDRLGALIGAVSDTVDDIRDQRPEAGTDMGALSAVLPERVAQVIQATQVPVDVVVALLTDTAIGRTGALRLDPTPPRITGGVATFTGRLRLQRPPGRRHVDLRVYPTTSANLTILELLPRRRWMPQTERYLRSGVPAVSELTDRIEAAAPTPPPTDSPPQ